VTLTACLYLVPSFRAACRHGNGAGRAQFTALCLNIKPALTLCVSNRVTITSDAAVCLYDSNRLVVGLTAALANRPLVTDISM
jgi:hypothetical protein